MNPRIYAGVAFGIVALAAVGGFARQQAPAAKSREADRQAIEESARTFAEAFNKGDAKTIASLWTEDGECQAPGGVVLRGRDEIEAAYTAFFKADPHAKIEVRVEGIRFPAADLAVEEGVLRQTRFPKDLPTSTLYRVTHVREGGQWRMAVSDEIADGIDRLDDLDWLVGEWKGKAGDVELSLSLGRDPKKLFLVGKFRRVENGQETTGTIRIAADPETGRLRSWHFDDEGGGHGQALWVRDDNRWVLDAVGVLGDGTPTASVNLLARVDADAITWQSIDRTLDGRPLPDTVPVRLTRVPAGGK